MKKMYLLLALLACGCVKCEDQTSDAISACSYGCQRSDKAMLKYSPTEGCLCEDKKK